MQGLHGVRRLGGVAACVVGTLVVVGLSAPSVRGQDGYTIAGEIDGLFPGADATLDARVTNPHPFTIRVISTSVTVLDANPACPASMLAIGDSRASFDVPPGGTGTVPLAVRMSLGAPDACQGATWPLEFTGTAVGMATSGLPSTSMIVAGGMALVVIIGTALLAGGLLAAGRHRRRHRPRAP
ncbi:MAG: hypothetical protein H0U86_18630 [Chloroflexi bacterium]|nr:hypothetical protein [Chloroflexota bacterium]